MNITCLRWQSSGKKGRRVFVHFGKCTVWPPEDLVYERKRRFEGLGQQRLVAGAQLNWSRLCFLAANAGGHAKAHTDAACLSICCIYIYIYISILKNMKLGHP